MPGKWGGARRARPPLDPPMQFVTNLKLSFFTSIKVQSYFCCSQKSLVFLLLLTLMVLLLKMIMY